MAWMGLGLLLLSSCAVERRTGPVEPAPAGRRFYLGVRPDDAVYMVDAVHCVVAEGPWSVPWVVWRDSAGGPARVRVVAHRITAREGEDFDSEPSVASFGAGADTCDYDYWPYRVWYGGVKIADNDVPEEDEQFLITLEDPTAGYVVDGRRGTIWVTIIDDDQPRPPVPDFHVPLETGDSWFYRATQVWCSPEMPGCFGSALDWTSSIESRVTFEGNDYARCGRQVERFLLRGEDAGLVLVPGDVEPQPPAPGDTLALERRQHLPWRLFDAAAAVPIRDQAFADTVCRYYDLYGDCYSASLVEGCADHGWSAIATPARVFRQVRRVSYYYRLDRWEGYGTSRNWHSYTWYVADSVGIVAELEYRDYYNGPGTSGSRESRSVLTRATAAP